jgi:hypothetical protein
MLVIVGLIVLLLAVIVARSTHLSARLSNEGLRRPGPKQAGQSHRRR